MICFWLALLTYVLCVGWTALFRITAGENPTVRFCQFHLLFSVPYLALAYYFGAPMVDVAIGLYFYFAFHYSIFLLVFLLASRSVSGNLLLTLFAKNRPVSGEELYRSYGSGKDFGRILVDRLNHMVKNEMLREDRESYRITSFGKFSSHLTKAILSIWGLNRIGQTHGD